MAELQINQFHIKSVNTYYRRVINARDLFGNRQLICTNGFIRRRLMMSEDWALDFYITLKTDAPISLTSYMQCDLILVPILSPQELESPNLWSRLIETATLSYRELVNEKNFTSGKEQTARIPHFKFCPSKQELRLERFMTELDGVFVRYDTAVITMVLHTETKSTIPEWTGNLNERELTRRIPVSLIDVYGSFLDNPFISDVVFRIYNPYDQFAQPTDIFASKSILVKRCSIMANLLSGNFQEGQTTQVIDLETSRPLSKVQRTLSNTSTKVRLLSIMSRIIKQRGSGKHVEIPQPRQINHAMTPPDSPPPTCKDREYVVIKVKADPSVFRSLLLYLYTDFIKFSSISEAEHIFCLADYFLLPNLQNRARQYISANLTTDTIGPLLFGEVGLAFTYDDFREMYMKYLKSEWEELREHHGFRELIRKEQRPELDQILGEIFTMVNKD